MDGGASNKTIVRFFTKLENNDVKKKIPSNFVKRFC